MELRTKTATARETRKIWSQSCARVSSARASRRRQLARWSTAESTTGWICRSSLHNLVDHLSPSLHTPTISSGSGCDHYSCVKMINYIRKEVAMQNSPWPNFIWFPIQSAPPSFLSPLPQPPYPWDNDSFLQPVLEQDPLLLVDWESETEQKSNSHSQRFTLTIAISPIAVPKPPVMVDLRRRQRSIKQLSVRL